MFTEQLISGEHVTFAGYSWAEASDVWVDTGPTLSAAFLIKSQSPRPEIDHAVR